MNLMEEHLKKGQGEPVQKLRGEPEKVRDLVGRMVRTKYELRTRSGRIFPGRTIFIVGATWRGRLSLYADEPQEVAFEVPYCRTFRQVVVKSKSMISQVSRGDVELLGDAVHAKDFTGERAGGNGHVQCTCRRWPNAHSGKWGGTETGWLSHVSREAQKIRRGPARPIPM